MQRYSKLDFGVWHGQENRVPPGRHTLPCFLVPFSDPANWGNSLPKRWPGNGNLPGFIYTTVPSMGCPIHHIHPLVLHRDSDPSRADILSPHLSFSQHGTLQQPPLPRHNHCLREWRLDHATFLNEMRRSLWPCRWLELSLSSACSYLAR